MFGSWYMWVLYYFVNVLRLHCGENLVLDLTKIEVLGVNYCVSRQLQTWKLTNWCALGWAVDFWWLYILQCLRVFLLFVVKLTRQRSLAMQTWRSFKLVTCFQRSVLKDPFFIKLLVLYIIKLKTVWISKIVIHNYEIFSSHKN